jgi:hypothetical protein
MNKHLTGGCGGHKVAPLGEALGNKSEGRGIDYQWGHWKFHWLNPSSRTMVLGSNQPVAGINTSISSGGKGGRCVGLTHLATFMCRLSRNFDKLNLQQPQGPVEVCTGTALPLLEDVAGAQLAEDMM